MVGGQLGTPLRRPRDDAGELGPCRRHDQWRVEAPAAEPVANKPDPQRGVVHCPILELQVQLGLVAEEPYRGLIAGRIRRGPGGSFLGHGP
jgi:hypothetical protein